MRVKTFACKRIEMESHTKATERLERKHLIFLNRPVTFPNEKKK